MSSPKWKPWCEDAEKGKIVMGKDDARRGMSRREFIQATGRSTVALGAGALAATPTNATAARRPGAGQSAADERYNILFILTDQERHFHPTAYPSGYVLPGRDGLKRRGVTFNNHQISSAVCSSSRSVIYTGQHIQHTKVFDNLNFPWSNDLSTEMPTLGDMLGEAGYYSAYKGKWHMSKVLNTRDEYALPQEKLTKVIESYGFKDYVGIGDIIGEFQGGHLNDDIIGAQARHWLRLHGQRTPDRALGGRGAPRDLRGDGARAGGVETAPGARAAAEASAEVATVAGAAVEAGAAAVAAADEAAEDGADSSFVAEPGDDPMGPLAWPRGERLS